MVVNHLMEHIYKIMWRPVGKDLQKNKNYMVTHYIKVEYSIVIFVLLWNVT